MADRPRVVVVGAGIVGTMHAVWAQRCGWDVVHLERDDEPRSATVRNFGLVWVSGRAAGEELDLAVRARDLWEAFATDAPGVGFRPDGSLTVVQRPDELAVLAEVAARRDAATRQVELLDADETRRINPAVRGDLLGALWCRADAVVEPGRALGALRDSMLGVSNGGGPTYRYLGGRTVTAINTGRVTDHTGAHHTGDLVVVCPGAEHHAGPLADLLGNAPVRRVMLQMMQTAPLAERLTTSVADGDSLRYYPAFDVPARAAMEPPAEVVERFALQLLVSQRAGGELTIGDTHHYDEPFDFACDETPYRELAARLERILGAPLPPVVRRWTGVYSQVADGAICWRDQPADGVWVITGPGGRGMTLSPAIAEQTWSAHLGVDTPDPVGAGAT
jgi:FAD dependent oxidoreductase TIGR03364